MRIPRILAVVLAGGKGSRLGALTANRVKPALPIAGTYRLIDVALSNLAHSHISDVWLVQQYLPHTLNRYLANGRPWDLDRSHGGLQVLPPFEGRPGRGLRPRQQRLAVPAEGADQEVRTRPGAGAERRPPVHGQLPRRPGHPPVTKRRPDDGDHRGVREPVPVRGGRGGRLGPGDRVRVQAGQAEEPPGCRRDVPLRRGPAAEGTRDPARAARRTAGLRRRPGALVR